MPECSPSHDSKRRDEESLYSNYTFTTLIDRFTSLHGVPRNFMVVKEPTYKIRASSSIYNGSLRRRSAVDPAVRMASAPAGRSKVNCFEKTLTRFVSQNRVIFYHGFGGMSIFRQKFSPNVVKSHTIALRCGLPDTPPRRCNRPALHGSRPAGRTRLSGRRFHRPVPPTG